MPEVSVLLSGCARGKCTPSDVGIVMTLSLTAVLWRQSCNLGCGMSRCWTQTKTIIEYDQFY